jgi:hypothetical protein
LADSRYRITEMFRQGAISVLTLGSGVKRDSVRVRREHALSRDLGLCAAGSAVVVPRGNLSCCTACGQSQCQPRQHALHPSEVAAARFSNNLLAAHQAVTAASRHEPSVAQLLQNPALHQVVVEASRTGQWPSVAQLLQSAGKNRENFRRSEEQLLEHGQEVRAEATHDPTVAQLLRNGKKNHEDVQRLEHMLNAFTAHASDGASQIQTRENERQMQTHVRESRMQTRDRTGFHTFVRAVDPAPEPARTITIVERDKYPVDRQLKRLVTDQVVAHEAPRGHVQGMGGGLKEGIQEARPSEVCVCVCVCVSECV